MKRWILFPYVFFFGVSLLSAQGNQGMFAGMLPENWTADVVASLHLSMNHSENWNDGESDASTWILQYDGDVKGHWSFVDWRNLMHLGWGKTYLEGMGSRKALDRLFLETTVYCNRWGGLKPFAGLRFESQFTKGYRDEDSIRTAVSSFMDPGYFTQMVGIAFVPSDHFSQRLAFANRMTFSDGYGWADDPDTKRVESFRDEPGLESVTEYTMNVLSLVTYKTRLWGFVNFKGLDAIDGKWENSLVIALAPLLELSLGIDLAYDKDVSEDHQYRDAVNLGVTWRWF